MKRVSPYLKMRVLGAIEFAQGNTIRQRCEYLSERVFTDEFGKTFRFTWKTILTWYDRYRRDGITSVKGKPRSDKGKTRKVNHEQLAEAVDQVLSHFREKQQVYNKKLIYRTCIEKGFLRQETCSLTSFQRLVKQYDLLKPYSKTDNKARLAFSKRYANEMWQVDTMYGPHTRRDGKPAKTKLICFIDDASRVIPHGEFFFSEGGEDLIKAFRSALYKRGIPEAMYADNGSPYTGKEFSQICARVGCLLCHAPVRDAAAKGKIERFFKFVRSNFLCRQLDLSSLEELNNQFTRWVEDNYHTRVHSTLGMRPLDRFGLDLKRIRFLPPSVMNEEFFFIEVDRGIAKDNTFSLKNIIFEAPRDLRKKKVQVRYNKHHFNKRAIVYYKAQRMGEARPVNYTANDRKPNLGKDKQS